MKTLLIATALVLIATSLAGAQSGNRAARDQASDWRWTSQSAGTSKQTSAKRVRKQPCAAYAPGGSCLGWDPDPHVRFMMKLDAGLDDY
jgi:hypothetical protein